MPAPLSIIIPTLNAAPDFALCLESLPGRGHQLKVGANSARGDWLLFLHADTVLSRDWAERVISHINTSPARAAAFSLAFRSDAPMATTVANRANWRARTLGLPYGDQGLLISRDLYDEVGGYEDVPLMEDVMIIRAIGKKRLSILSAQARTSAARYERDGWHKRSWTNLTILARFLMGASPEKLAKAYR